MNETDCGIPEHEWLVIELDDALDDLDPMGLVDDRHRPHEYQPEIPGLIRMIVTDTLTETGVKDLFMRFFGDPLHAAVSMAELHGCVKEVADRWHDLVERTARSWHGEGELWRSIWVQQHGVDGTWTATFIGACIGYINDMTETLEGCTSLEEAVAAAQKIDWDYHSEVTLGGEEG